MILQASEQKPPGTPFFVGVTIIICLIPPILCYYLFIATRKTLLLFIHCLEEKKLKQPGPRIELKSPILFTTMTTFTLSTTPEDVFTKRFRHRQDIKQGQFLRATVLHSFQSFYADKDYSQLKV